MKIAIAPHDRPLEDARLRSTLALAVLLAVAMFAPPLALAQGDEPAEEPAATGEEQPEKEFTETITVTTGTREVGVQPAETMSPVDVLLIDAIADQSTPDFTDSLTKVAPSINTQRFPIADGTAFIRPASLRNLSPDHTLVLLNGTRRHRSALVNLQLAPLGTVNQGSQAVDLSTLPAGAIERIEILRDGASAQYGSDAIAGVINLILKDDREGFSVMLQTGEYFDNDGERTTASVNGGFALGAEGFLNGTIEYTESDKTWRGQARPDAAFVASIVGAEKTPLNGLGQRWGDPAVEAYKIFLNAGVPINDNVDFYANASYVENETVSDFFYREPVLDQANQLKLAARKTLQRDANGDGLPDPAPQTLVNSIVSQGLNPADYLVADASSPSGYVLRNPIYTLFPGGYNPDFGAEIKDTAAVFGVRGTAGGDLTWDVSGRWAEDEVDYTLSESINPSLGRLSPTSFRPGNLTQEETSVNLDFVKPVEVEALASPLNLAFGFEYRDETYKLGAGDPGSRVAGPTAAIFGVGSDGFQGFPLESAGSFSSESYAGYVDLEANFTEQFSGGVAARFEDYEVFGSTFDWKLSGRYDFTEKIAVRATANTGFRAPTPGQLHTLNVTTTADSTGQLIPSGVYPVDHPVALALGSVPLEPEESQAFTVGLVARPASRTTFTLDYYQIEIDDRLAIQNNTVTAGDLPRLIAAGVQNPELLVGSVANFFSNAFDCEVTGVDVAVTSFFDVADGLLTVDLRHNQNETDVTRVLPGSLNGSRIFDLENQVPEQRTNLTLSYDTGKMFAGFVRAARYGSWESTGGLFSPKGDASDAASYGSAVLVDAELQVKFLEHYEFSIGGENIFDERPDKEQDGTLQYLGVVDSLTSPFGFNGGQWYVRLAAHF